jgi:hypothetical protein
MVSERVFSIECVGIVHDKVSQIHDATPTSKGTGYRLSDQVSSPVAHPA